MKKIALMLACLFYILSVSAQKAEVVKALSKYNVSDEVLNINAKQNTDEYIYQIRQITKTPTAEKTEIADYDPRKPAGERWELLTVNGSKPSSIDKKAFIKAHPIQPPVPKIDDNSYKIVSQNADSTVVSYKYDQGTLDKDNDFLRDCSVRLCINNKTAVLQKVESANDKPLKIKGISIPTLHTESAIIYDTNANKYFPEKEVTIILAKVMFLPVKTTITTVYSNYKKP